MNPVKDMAHLVAASPLSESDRKQRAKKQKKSKMCRCTEQTLMRLTNPTDVDGILDDTGDSSSSNNINNNNSKGTITTKETSVMSDNSFSSCLIDSKQESIINAMTLSDLLETDAPKPANIITINGTRTILSEMTTSPSRDELCITKNDDKSTDSHLSNKGPEVCDSLYSTSDGQRTKSHENQQETVPILTEVVSKTNHSKETGKHIEEGREFSIGMTHIIARKTVSGDGEQSSQVREESQSRSSTMSSSSTNWVPTSPAGQQLQRLLAKQASMERKERKEKKRLVKIAMAQSLECPSNRIEPTLDMLLGQDMDMQYTCPTVFSGLSSVVLSNKFEPKVLESHNVQDDERKRLKKAKRRSSKDRILGDASNDHDSTNKYRRSSGRERLPKSSSRPLAPGIHNRRDLLQRSRVSLGSRSSRSLERKSRNHQGFSRLERSSSCSLIGASSKRRRDRGLSLGRSRSSSRHVKSSAGSSSSSLRRSTSLSLDQLRDRGCSLEHSRRSSYRGLLESSSSSVNRSKSKSLERRRDRGTSLNLSTKSVILASLFLEPSPLSVNGSTGQALKSRRHRGGSLDRPRSCSHVNGSSSELSALNASVSKSQQGLHDLVVVSDRSRSSRVSHKSRNSRSLDRKSRGSGCDPRSCRRSQQTTGSRQIVNDGLGLDISSLTRNGSDSMQATSQSSRRSSSRRRSEHLDFANSSRDRSSSVTTRSDRSIRSSYGSINLSPLESKDGHDSLIQWLVEDPNSQVLFLKWLTERDRPSESEHDCVITGESIEEGQKVTSPMNDDRTQSSAQETTESRTLMALARNGVSVVRLKPLSPEHSSAESKIPSRMRKMVCPYNVGGVGASTIGSTTRSCDLSDTTPVARNSLTRQEQRPFSSKLEPLPQASPVNLVSPVRPSSFMSASSMSSSVPTEDHLLTPPTFPCSPVEAILIGIVTSNGADIAESEYSFQEKEFDENLSRVVHSADGISVRSEITGLTSGSVFPLVPSTVRTTLRKRVCISLREPIVDEVDYPETRPLDVAPTSEILLLKRRYDEGLGEVLSGIHGGLRSPPDDRSTSFGTVEVREYERILGDHPSCSDGLSIGIDWGYRAVQSYCVDEWEATRNSLTRGSFHLDRKAREDMLRELGYDRQEFAKAMRESNKIKHQRRQTLQNLGAQRIEEAIESCGRKALRAILLGGKNNCPN